MRILLNILNEFNIFSVLPKDEQAESGVGGGKSSLTCADA